MIGRRMRNAHPKVKFKRLALNVFEILAWIQTFFLFIFIQRLNNIFAFPLQCI